MILIVRAIIFVCAALGAIDQVEQKERRLTWTDYKGAVPRRAYYAATTFSTVKISYAPASGGLIAQPVYIWCEFSESRSWVNRSVLAVKSYQRLLQHETNHYRLNIICAKLLKKSISGYRQVPEKKLRELTATYTQAFDKRNRRYDTETNHGTIISKQLEWEKQIARELAGLENTKLLKP